VTEWAFAFANPVAAKAEALPAGSAADLAFVGGAVGTTTCIQGPRSGRPKWLGGWRSPLGGRWLPTPVLRLALVLARELL